ncbi:MAG: amidohydrolase [Chloroflexi bacterium]|nr:amidohydrolase [Chloroflexota bacterium]MBV9597748.1 amidohydrolase [Chloroflexota bacterium]
MHELLEQAHALLDDVARLRRAIHREPELGLDLPLTQAKVLDALQGLPLEIHRGQRTTSVMADLRGSQSGRTIILRGDMDALPLQEDTDVPFKSTIDGRMHACGHDAHTAMLAGAARLLAQHQQALSGTVRFMFQPGEEGYAGAVVMMDEGLLDAPSGGSPPTAAYALHAAPRWAPGTVLTRPGPVLASTDNFTIVVRGRGGHASAPHMAADPVPVACEIGMALQTLVTRSVNVFSPAVLTIGKIQAGTASNIIPEIATLDGTIRTLAPETRATLVEGVHRVARGVSAAHGLEAEVTNTAGYPVTVNDADFARFVLATGREILGAEHCLEQPSPQLAGEDFAYVLEHIPGAMSSLGTRPFAYAEGEAPNAHSNRYLLNEEALAAGMAMYAGVALAYLKE